MTTDILDAILAYVSLFFIARYLGPYDYGIIGFAIGYVGLFTMVSSLGFNEAHIKRVSGGEDLGTCIGTFLSVKLILLSIMTALTIGTVFFWLFIIGRGFETPIHEAAIYIILLYFILEKTATIFQITFTAQTKIAKTYLPRLIGTIARTGAIIYVAISGFGAIELAFAYVFGHFFLFLSSLVFFKGYPLKKPTKESFKKYLTFAWPLLIVSSSALIMTHIDKVLIQMFYNANDVGYYFATFRITGFIVMAGSSIGGLLFPTISALHKKNDKKAIKQILHQSERYVSMLTFPMVAGIIVLASPAITILLSKEFIPAIPIFRILPIYALLYALSIPYHSQLLGMDKPKLERNRILLMVTTNVLLNILLIPKDIQSLGLTLFGLGPTGAAIATVISYTLGYLYCRYTVYKILQVRFNYRLILHLFASSIMSIILYWISFESGILVINRWYSLLAISLLGLGIYLGILFICREFTKKDILFLLDTFNIKKMYHYISGEIKQK